MDKPITYEVNGEQKEISWSAYFKEIDERRDARLKRKEEAEARCYNDIPQSNAN